MFKSKQSLTYIYLYMKWKNVQKAPYGHRSLKLLPIQLHHFQFHYFKIFLQLTTFHYRTNHWFLKLKDYFINTFKMDQKEKPAGNEIYIEKFFIFDTGYSIHY